LNVTQRRASLVALPAAQRFFDALFVTRDHEAASRFFLPSFSACVDLAVSSKQQSAGDPAGTEESLRGYLQQIAPRAPSAQKLEEIIERSDPDNPTLGVVHHGHEQAYLLASVPDDEHPISCIVVSSAHIRVLRRKMTVEERRRKTGPPVVHINIGPFRVSTDGNLNGWNPTLLAIIYRISNVEHRVVTLTIKLSACIQDLLSAGVLAFT
jgi:hypothetical protein